MQLYKFTLIVFAGLVLASCNLSDLEGGQAKQFAELTEKFQMTPSEIDVAELTIIGYKNELGTPVVASRDLRQAICYATSVEMPDKYAKAHLLYLEHYAEADKDYYAWFAEKGIGAEMAEDMGNIYVAAHNKCKTMRGRLDNLKALKARRNL